MRLHSVGSQLRRQAPAWIRSTFSRRSRPRTIRLLLRIALLACLVPLFLQILLAYVVAKDARLLPPALQQAKSLLIVTAHPDDECLFFAPSILGVLEANPGMVGGLLVLSTGNNYGIGHVRKNELQGSCEALGIASDRCVALDRADLQDSPTTWWDVDVVAHIVTKYVEKWGADAILTFDQGGVSGHVNHRAVSQAVRKYASVGVEAPPTYMVSTTSLARKYTFLGDVPLTSLPFSWRIMKALVSRASVVDARYDDKALIANTWGRYWKTRRAFGKHRSQYSWDRNLYMIFSRYVWINDLRRVGRGDVR